MAIRMRDNSHIYVTCICILKAIRSLDRTRRARVKRTGKEYGSLGDFPVGTSGAVLAAAYDQHIQDVGYWQPEHEGR